MKLKRFFILGTYLRTYLLAEITDYLTALITYLIKFLPKLSYLEIKILIFIVSIEIAVKKALLPNRPSYLRLQVRTFKFSFFSFHVKALREAKISKSNKKYSR